MLEKEKFFRFFLTKKLNIFFITFFLIFFVNNISHASFREKLITKYKTIDTLYFDFVQTIGEKEESGNCYIKYPLRMRCEYSENEKSIVKLTMIDFVNLILLLLKLKSCLFKFNKIFYIET